MNEVNAYLQPLLLLLSVLILSGCPPPVEPEPRGPAYIEWDDWPVTSDGFDRFFTEDPRYSRSGGVAFWRVTSPAASPMTVLETQMKKISGDPKMGFGIIFCIQNDRFLLVKDRHRRLLRNQQDPRRRGNGHPGMDTQRSAQHRLRQSQYPPGGIQRREKGVHPHHQRRPGADHLQRFHRYKRPPRRRLRLYGGSLQQRPTPIHAGGCAL